MVVCASRRAANGTPISGTSLCGNSVRAPCHPPPLASEPEAVETLNYTRYVLDVGHTGDALELLTALMPCVAGYAEIGLTLLHDPATRFEGNPYAAWIENYGDEAYLAGVRSSLSLFETLARQRAGEQRFNPLAAIFTTATRLEAAFWQMGLNHAAAQRISS